MASARRPRQRKHARSGYHHGGGQRESNLLAQKDYHKESYLHGLGFGVGDGDHEGALPHRCEHQCRRQDLAYRAEGCPEKGDRIRPWHFAIGERDGRQRQQTKRQTKNEPGMGRADCSKPFDEALLGSVAEGSGDCSKKGEDYPQPRRGIDLSMACDVTG